MLPSFPHIHRDRDRDRERGREGDQTETEVDSHAFSAGRVSFILSKSVSVEERKEIEGVLLLVGIELR